MKQADVRVGMECKTKVGADLVRVRVIAAHPMSSKSRDRWRVGRVDNGRELQKSRTAAALRLV